MLKETENKETRLLQHFYLWWHFDWGAAPVPGYTYDCNFNAICDIKILCAFLLVCPSTSEYVCQSDTNGSILYNYAKYVILLVKVKIML